jgi:uncharacterized membrane protein (UPF0127 family)
MNVIINNKSYPAEVMETFEEKQKGMMGRDSLEGCMVFNMGKGFHSFWMKNTLIPLDIIFVNDKRISNIHLNCQPGGRRMNPPSYTGIGNLVIEFPSGTCDNFKIGDKVSLY